MDLIHAHAYTGYVYELIYFSVLIFYWYFPKNMNALQIQYIILLCLPYNAYCVD